MDKITIDYFNKIEIRVGKVIGAENVEKSEKLIRLVVDFTPEINSSLSEGVPAGAPESKGLKDSLRLRSGNNSITGNLSTSSGNKIIRIIFTGVRTYGYTAEDFLNKQFLFVTNIPYRKMPSYAKASDGKMVQEDSQGMILAVDPPSQKSIGPLRQSSSGASEASGLKLPLGVHGSNKPLFIEVKELPLGVKVR